MRHLLAGGAFAAWALAHLTTAHAEDLTIIATVKVNGGSPHTFTRYLTPGRVREGLDGETEIIRDLASDAFTVIDHGKKQYWASAHEDFVAIRHHVKQQIEALRPLRKKQDRLGQLFALEKKKLGAQEVSVQKGASPRRIAGYDCNHHVMSWGSQVTEIWATTALQPPSGYRDPMAYSVPSLLPKDARDRLFKEIKEQGLPLATVIRNPAGGPPMFEMEATDVKTGPIPVSAFDPPPGYEQAESPVKEIMRTAALDARIGPLCEALFDGQPIGSPALGLPVRIMKEDWLLRFYLASKVTAMPFSVATMPFSVAKDFRQEIIGEELLINRIWYTDSKILQAVTREWKPASETLLCIRETSRQVGRYVMKGTAPSASGTDAYEVIWEARVLHAGEAKAHKKTFSSYPPAEIEVLGLMIKAPEGRAVETTLAAGEWREPPLRKFIDWLRQSEGK